MILFCKWCQFRNCSCPLKIIQCRMRPWGLDPATISPCRCLDTVFSRVLSVYAAGLNLTIILKGQSGEIVLPLIFFTLWRIYRDQDMSFNDKNGNQKSCWTVPFRSSPEMYSAVISMRRSISISRISYLEAQPFTLPLRKMCLNLN